MSPKSYVFNQVEAARELRLLRESAARWQDLGEGILYGVDPASYEQLRAIGFGREYSTFERESDLLEPVVGHRATRRRTARVLSQWDEISSTKVLTFKPGRIAAEPLRVATRALMIAASYRMYAFLAARHLSPHTTSTTNNN